MRTLRYLLWIGLLSTLLFISQTTSSRPPLSFYASRGATEVQDEKLIEASIIALFISKYRSSSDNSNTQSWETVLNLLSESVRHNGQFSALHDYISRALKSGNKANRGDLYEKRRQRLMRQLYRMQIHLQQSHRTGKRVAPLLLAKLIRFVKLFQHQQQRPRSQVVDCFEQAIFRRRRNNSRKSRLMIRLMRQYMRQTDAQLCDEVGLKRNKSSSNNRRRKFRLRHLLQVIRLLTQKNRNLRRRAKLMKAQQGSLLNKEQEIFSHLQRTARRLQKQKRRLQKKANLALKALKTAAKHHHKQQQAILDPKVWKRVRKLISMLKSKEQQMSVQQKAMKESILRVKAVMTQEWKKLDAKQKEWRNLKEDEKDHLKAQKNELMKLAKELQTKQQKLVTWKQRLQAWKAKQEKKWMPLVGKWKQILASIKKQKNSLATRKARVDAFAKRSMERFQTLFARLKTRYTRMLSMEANAKQRAQELVQERTLFLTNKQKRLLKQIQQLKQTQSRVAEQYHSLRASVEQLRNKKQHLQDMNKELSRQQSKLRQQVTSQAAKRQELQSLNRQLVAWMKSIKLQVSAKKQELASQIGRAKLWRKQWISKMKQIKAKHQVMVQRLNRFAQETKTRFAKLKSIEQSKVARLKRLSGRASRLHGMVLETKTKLYDLQHKLHLGKRRRAQLLKRYSVLLRQLIGKKERVVKVLRRVKQSFSVLKRKQAATEQQLEHLGELVKNKHKDLALYEWQSRAAHDRFQKQIQEAIALAKKQMVSWQESKRLEWKAKAQQLKEDREKVRLEHAKQVEDIKQQYAKLQEKKHRFALKVTAIVGLLQTKQEAAHKRYEKMQEQLKAARELVSHEMAQSIIAKKLILKKLVKAEKDGKSRLEKQAAQVQKMIQVQRDHKLKLEKRYARLKEIMKTMKSQMSAALDAKAKCERKLEQDHELHVGKTEDGHLEISLVRKQD